MQREQLQVQKAILLQMINLHILEHQLFTRLVLVDKDGTKKYSNVVNVTLKAKGSFVKKLYPNPVLAGNTMQVEIISNRTKRLTYSYLALAEDELKICKHLL